QPETWRQAVFSNFGGVGNRHEEYQPERVRQDMDKLFSSADFRAGLGLFGAQVIEQFFDAQQVHEQLLGVYRLAIVSHALQNGAVSSAISVVASVAVTSKQN